MQNDAEKRTKVLVLLGSPRKNGNSTLLAREIAKGAESAGADVETLYINAMNITPCQGCRTCQKEESKGCAIDDDMQTIYPKLAGADAWVIASPVHWFNMSTQTKLWLDRCFALGKYGKNPFQKRIGIAMAFGDSDPFASGCVNAIRSFQDCFKYVGAEITGTVYGSALNAGDISRNSELLKTAEALGRKLAA